MGLRRTDLAKAQPLIQPDRVVQLESTESHRHPRFRCLSLQAPKKHSPDPTSLEVRVYHQFSDVDVVGPMFDDAVSAVRTIDAQDLRSFGTPLAFEEPVLHRLIPWAELSFNDFSVGGMMRPASKLPVVLLSPTSTDVAL